MRASRRTVPIRRSTHAFCHGDRGEIGRSRMPNGPYPRPEGLSIGTVVLSHQVGRASVICRATPSAVGVVSPRAEMVAVLRNSWISSANSATEATGSTRSWLPPPFNSETG
jgi:hypothetical protein